MEPDRSDQVAARVVAWHNRHPLARRIQPAQVHSIGVVSLPFAVDGALPRPLPEAVVESIDPATDPTTEPTFDPATEAVASEAAGPATPMSAEPDGAAALEILTEVVVTDQDDDPAQPAVELAEALPAPPDPGSLEPGPEPIPAPIDAPPAAPAIDAAAEGPPRWIGALPPPQDPRRAMGKAWDPRRWSLLRPLLSFWPVGRRPLRGLFSEDFIEPLTPRKVERWVAAHGSFERPLGADAPERQVLLDPALLAAEKPALPVSVHVLTAAIGSEGRRVRLLLSPLAGGPILGARQWDRRRVAGAATLSMLAFGAALSPRYWPLPELPPMPASTAAAASHPVASAPEAAMHAAEVPAEVVAEVTAQVAAASASAPTDDGPDGAQVDARVPAHESTAVVADAAPATERPVDVEPTLGRIELPPIRPQRVAPSARQPEPAPAPPVEPRHAYALVMQPTRSRGESEALARRLRQQAGAAAGRSQADLLQSGDTWRAILFPFGDARQAEKARQVLAGKGLAVEMIEF